MRLVSATDPRPASPSSQRAAPGIYDLVSDGIVVLDDHRLCLDANRAAAALIGRPVHELRQVRVDELVPEPLRARLPALWARLLRTGRDAGSCRVPGPDGSTRHVRCSVTANVTPGRHVAILRDVTAQRAAEDEARRVAAIADTRLRWVDRVREALRAGRFVLHAQPIVDLASAATVSDELLVRMVDRTGAVLPPTAFLPAAERCGLIREIDDWVVAEGLRLAGTAVPVSINLSPRSVADPETLPHIVRQLARAGADPAAVTFEIRGAIADLDDARAFVEELRRLGCGVALDDFGAGFATLAYLKHLPVSQVKIDMELIRDLRTSETDRQIVMGIAGIARGLGIQTVAEGVEDAATAELLRSCGVDLAQGSYFGRPASLGGRS